MEFINLSLYIGVVYVVPVLTMLGLGLALPLLLVFLYNQFHWGLIAIALAFIADAITLGEPFLHVGVNLFYPDVLLGPIMGVAVLRLLLAPDAPRLNKAWLVFCITVGISTVTGLAQFGAGAGVQARGYFYFVAATLYGASFEINAARIQQIIRTLVWTALTLMALAVYRWIVYYAPISALLPPGGSYNVDGAIRVIYANHAIVLAEVLIAGLFFTGISQSLQLAQLCAPLLLGMVLALQHRSVWLATLVGMGSRFVVVRTRTTSILQQLCLIAGIALVTSVPLVFSDKLGDVTQQIGQSAGGALRGEGTVREQLASWQEIISIWSHKGPREIAFGESFGADNTRSVQDEHGYWKKINYIAHNLFVQNLYNTGAIGFLAYLLANIHVLRGLYQRARQPDGDLQAAFLMVLMLMQLAYYIPYGVDFLQGVVFGAALAYLARPANAPVALPDARLPAVGALA